MSVNPNAMYSRSDWAALSITDRIKAMHDTLDAVEGTDEIHFDFSRKADQQQQEEPVQSLPKSRASVVDMWRKRDSTSLGSSAQQPENNSPPPPVAQHTTITSVPVLGSSSDPTFLVSRANVFAQARLQEDEVPVVRQYGINRANKPSRSSSPRTVETTASSVTAATDTQSMSVNPIKTGSRPPTPRSAGRQVVVMPWDVPEEEEEEEEQQQQPGETRYNDEPGKVHNPITFTPTKPEAVTPTASKPRVQKLSSQLSKGPVDLEVAPAVETQSPVAAAAQSKQINSVDRLARQRSLSSIMDAAATRDEVSSEVPSRSSVVELWNQRSPPKANSVVNEKSKSAAPATFRDHFAKFVVTNEATPPPPKADSMTSPPKSAESNRVIDRWVKRQDSIRMEKEEAGGEATASGSITPSKADSKASPPKSSESSRVIDRWVKRQDSAQMEMDAEISSEALETITSPPKSAESNRVIDRWMQRQDSARVNTEENDKMPSQALSSSPKFSGSSRVLDRWMKRQDSARMEEADNKKTTSPGVIAAIPCTGVSPSTKPSLQDVNKPVNSPSIPLHTGQSTASSELANKARGEEAGYEFRPDRSLPTASYPAPETIRNPSPQIAHETKCIAENSALGMFLKRSTPSRTMNTASPGTPPLSPKASGTSKYNNHSPRLTHATASLSMSDSTGGVAIDTQQSPKASQVARMLNNDFSPKAASNKVNVLGKLSQSNLDSLVKANKRREVLTPSSSSPRGSSKFQFDSTSESFIKKGKSNDQKPVIPKESAVSVTRGTVASRWLERAAIETDTASAIESIPSPRQKAGEVPWPTENDSMVTGTHNSTTPTTPGGNGSLKISTENPSVLPSPSYCSIESNLTKCQMPNITCETAEHVDSVTESSPKPISPSRTPSSPSGSLCLPKATKASPLALANAAKDEVAEQQNFKLSSYSSAFASVHRGELTSSKAGSSDESNAAHPPSMSKISLKQPENLRIADKLNKRKNRLRYQKIKMRPINSEEATQSVATPPKITSNPSKSSPKSPILSSVIDYSVDEAPLIRDEAVQSDVAAGDANNALTIHSTLSNLSICSSTFSRTSSLTDKAERLLHERRQYKLRGSPSKSNPSSPSKAPSISIKNYSITSSPPQKTENTKSQSIKKRDVTAQGASADVARDMFGARNRYETESRLLGPDEDPLLQSDFEDIGDLPSLENTSLNNRSGASMEHSHDTSVISSASSIMTKSTDERSFLPFEKEALDALEKSKIATEEFHLQNTSNFDAFSGALSSVSFGDIAKDMAREMNKFTSEIFNYKPRLSYETQKVKFSRRIEDVPFDEAQEDTAIEVEYMALPEEKKSMTVVDSSADDSAWNSESAKWPESFKRTSSRKR